MGWGNYFHMGDLNQMIMKKKREMGNFARGEEPLQTLFSRQVHFRKDSVQLPFLALSFIPGSPRMLAEIFTLIQRAIALQLSLVSLGFIVFICVCVI